MPCGRLQIEPSIATHGRVTADNSGELRAALRSALRKRPAELRVDLSELSYTDTSGLAALVEAFQTANKQATRLALVASRASHSISWRSPVSNDCATSRDEGHTMNSSAMYRYGALSPNSLITITVREPTKEKATSGLFPRHEVGQHTSKCRVRCRNELRHDKLKHAPQEHQEVHAIIKA